MFRLFTSQAYDLMLKTNVKRWERVLYGGRPEFYPEDKKMMFTLLEFRNQRQERGRKRAEAESRMKEHMQGGRR
jgi:hypothetical protein